MLKYHPILYLLLLLAPCYSAENCITVGVFDQEKRTFYTRTDGLPADNVHSIALTDDGIVYAATDSGLAFFTANRWQPIHATLGRSIRLLATNGQRIAATLYDSENSGACKSILLVAGDKIVKTIPLTDNFSALALADQIYFAREPEISALDNNNRIHFLPTLDGEVRQICLDAKKRVYLAATAGLFQYDSTGKTWQPLFPQQGKKNWLPRDARGLTCDRNGILWFACPQGVGCRKGEQWFLYTAQDGLPYDDFTAIATGEEGVVWFGTRKGAIRFDGKNWEYRQGLRWLPDDQVNAVAVSAQGRAWFATPKGVAVIERKPMTLAQKATWFEDEIDRYHRRTPYEYVLEVSLKRPGDKSEWTQQDSDNDGLWTAMYGSGECFAYGATKDPLARKRSLKAFKALQFLSKVTQGGTPPAPDGFVARTILPTSGRDPNIGRLAADQRREKQSDGLWKILQPRWPKSKDGKWYWKTDTSSDELDGHYFFYGAYFDLAAESEAEKAEVRELVSGLTDHIIRHGYNLVDHDGKPTRWARYSPAELNLDARWFVERGLNSLSILSYLYTTAHITGEKKYLVAADSLINKHGYLQNLMCTKLQRGVGGGNQSDDEMAFMCYYNLCKYAPEQIKGQVAVSMLLSWRMEYPEMNPFFNFAAAAMCEGRSYQDHWGVHPLTLTGSWLEDAVATLQRFPLDRIDWRHDNTQRTDLVRLSEIWAAYDDDPGIFPQKGYCVNGKVIPVDERHFNHWNHDPFALTTGGNGHELADGAVFLLPYYMGLYHGFIKESN